MLRPLGLTVFGSMGMNVAALTSPPMVTAFEALKEAGQASLASVMHAVQSVERMKKLGFPPMFLMEAAFASAPFDAMSDTLRGMRGVMLDMHRRPEKLLAGIEKMRKIITKDAQDTCHALGFKYAGSMLHRGSDGFMSLKQFETFYWPSLKQMWLDLIDAGITPFVFYEGIWDQRLEYLAELPKGKTIGWFQSSDIYKVKQVLGDTMCIMGGMPNSMLQGGTPEQIREHTRKVCEKVGKDGGFIMSVGIGEMEGSDPDLVKVWVDATREYGLY